MDDLDVERYDIYAAVRTGLAGGRLNAGRRAKITRRGVDCR